jgi:hypothetical protein
LAPSRFLAPPPNPAESPSKADNGQKAHLLIKEIADRIVPDSVKQVLQPQGPELVHPDAVVIRELALRGNYTDGSAKRGNLRSQRETSWTTPHDADVYSAGVLRVRLQV